MDDVAKLSKFLNYVMSYTVVHPNGEIFEQRELVEKIDGYKVEIYPNDHLPPHFHIKGPELNVSIKIDNCEIIKGQLTKSLKKKIEYFHSLNKLRLIETWNKLRPSNYEKDKI